MTEFERIQKMRLDHGREPVKVRTYKVDNPDMSRLMERQVIEDPSEKFHMTVINARPPKPQIGESDGH